MQTLDNSPEMQRFAAAMEPAPQRWHIGQNIVGYVPEGDVYCFEGSEDDARDAARGEAIRALEDCDGGCELPDDAHSDSLNLDGSGDYYLDNHDCGYLGPLALHIWYASCDTPAECAAEEN